MSHSEQIVTALLQEDLIGAKNLIREAIMAKVGDALELKLTEFAPTVFNDDDLIEGWTDGVPDAEALSMELNNLQNTGSPSAELSGYLNQNSALQDIRRSAQPQQVPINAGFEAELQEVVDEFEQDLSELVEEIQADTGEILTEEEIIELAERYLDTLASDR